MNLLSRVFGIACLVAAVVSAPGPAKPSPCPEQFQYDGAERPGQWEGTLRVLTEDSLQGLWIRVKFDAPIKEIVVREKDFEVESRSTDNVEFLLKNSNYHLKAKVPLNLKISVKYDGNKVPRLMGYRLNARTVCPEQNGDPSDAFQGDVNSPDLLSLIVRNPTSSNLPKFECGTVNPKINPYPWQATILFNEPNKKARYLCEGTLITPKHVLTTAHCVTYLANEGKLSLPLLSIAFGKVDLKHEVHSKQETGVVGINVYPGYKFANILNDIAIIELSALVAIDDSVRPICLPERAEKESKKSIVVGYTLDKKLNAEGKLESAEVKEIKNDECERRVPDLKALIGDNTYCASYSSGSPDNSNECNNKSKPEDKENVFIRYLCGVYNATNTDESRCVGDSGSSVASLRGSENVWELRGIVTLGVALQNKYVCNQSSTVLLADISKYLKWIRASTL